LACDQGTNFELIGSQVSNTSSGTSSSGSGSTDSGTSGTSSSGSGSTDSDWSGSYSLDQSCDGNSCCCADGVLSVSQQGSTVTFSSSAARGQCGGLQSVSGSFAISESNSNTATFTLSGQSYQATKNGATVQLTNLDAPVCSGIGTQGSAKLQNQESSSSTTSASIFVVGLVVGLI
jgi:hypothetical protein